MDMGRVAQYEAHSTSGSRQTPTVMWHFITSPSPLAEAAPLSTPCCPSSTGQRAAVRQRRAGLLPVQPLRAPSHPVDHFQQPPRTVPGRDRPSNPGNVSLTTALVFAWGGLRFVAGGGGWKEQWMAGITIAFCCAQRFCEPSRLHSAHNAPMHPRLLKEAYTPSPRHPGPRLPETPQPDLNLHHWWFTWWHHVATATPTLPHPLAHHPPPRPPLPHPIQSAASLSAMCRSPAAPTAPAAPPRPHPPVPRPLPPRPLRRPRLLLLPRRLLSLQRRHAWAST